MNAKQAENLRILADHMEGISRVLDMRYVQNCGTPACALGEMTAVPHFRSQGICLRQPHQVGAHSLRQNGEQLAPFDAGRDLFGLSAPEAYELFGTPRDNRWKRSNVTGQEWASAAREILAKHGYPASKSVKQPERIENLDPTLSALLKKLNMKEVA